MKTNKVLLTGASGFLGRYLHDFLSKHYVVHTLGRNTANNFVCDLTHQIPNFNETCFEMVVHTAGKAHIVPSNENEKQDFFQVNVEGTKHLLQALEKSSSLPLYFIFISSVAVYGLEQGINIDEATSLNAQEPYGKSKIIAEQMIEEWSRKNNVIVTILRPPLIVGRQPKGNLEAMIKGIHSGKYFRIGQGKARKSMVLASDMASFIPIVAQYGGIYNLTDGQHPNFADIENKLAKQLKKNIKIMPLWVAKIVALCGDFINLVAGSKKFPLDSRTLSKITDTLTFSDQKARKIGWKPEKVLDKLII